jgi:hypothetical protein
MMAFLPKAPSFAPPTKATRRLDSTARNTRQRTDAAIATPDLLAVVAFCLIGLLLGLLALGVMSRFPDLGAVIEQYNQF